MDAILAMFTILKVVKMEASPKGESMDKDEIMKINSTRDGATAHEPELEQYHGRGRLLCLDSGGFRGLILAQMFEIKKFAQTPITNRFDWIARTSTGGILALGLGCGKTMRHTKCLYLRVKHSLDHVRTVAKIYRLY